MNTKHCSIIICHYSLIDDFGAPSAGVSPPSRSDLVRVLMESLEKYTDYPVEIILMDNGGNPDDSSYFLEKVREGKINTYVRYKNNMHFAYAFNQGARLATGRYLAFVCNDIELGSGWLSTCINLLERYPERKFIATPFITYDKKKHTIEYLDGNRVNMRSGSNCMVMRRESFYDIGEFLHHRIAGSIWFTKMFRMGYRTIAPPEDLAIDRGWRKGVAFNIPIKVAQTLLDGSVIDYAETDQITRRH